LRRLWAGDFLSVLEDGFLLLDYRILKVLGSGGFGVTYLVRDENLKRLFAIKEYFPSEFSFRSGVTVRPRERREADFAWGKERFLDEARTLACFDHSNIVKVVRIFDANSTSYMVQEYQSGRDLKQWAAGLDSPPTQTELDQLIAPLLDALSVVHRNEVLHRDISPDNIYIRDDGTPVLLDFGSARQAVAQRTETVSAMVKSGFSPVELYSTKGKGQGPWSDIYAFAATLYSLVTGSAPEQATERLVEDDYVALKQTAPGLGQYRQSFLTAIDWGLKLPQAQRPRSVEEWRPALLEDAAVKPDQGIVSPGLAPDTVDRPRPGPWEPLGSAPPPERPAQSRQSQKVQAPVAESSPARTLLLVLAGIGILLAGAFIADQQKTKTIADQQQTKTIAVQQQTQQEDDAWNKTSWSDLDGLRNFVRNFPASKRRSAAEDQIRTLQNTEAGAKAARELQAWQNTQFNDLNSLQTFVRNFPDSQHRAAVDNQIRALEMRAQAAEKEAQAWRNTLFDDVDSLRTFVRNFPNGQYRAAAEDRIRTLEARVTPPDPPAVSFTMSSSAGQTVRVAFYDSASKTQIDPAAGMSYVLNGNETRNYRISCTPGANICYGAFTEGNGLSPFWGAGRGGQQGCTRCCLTCTSGTVRMSETLTMASSRTPPPTVTLKVTDQTTDHLSIAYYSGTRYQHGWPGWDKNWSLVARETTHSVSCIAGEKICYGAWQTNNPYGGRYWGVGPLNKYGCTSCCTTCDGGVFSFTLTD
jgi:serine/threonine protein kinase